MTRRLILILSILCLLGFIGVCAIVFQHVKLPLILSYGLWILLICGGVIWSYIYIRVIIFQGRLIKLFRRILAGDYESGISLASPIKDEIASLVDLTNKMADQLRLYDRLRVDRISLLARAFDQIALQSKDAVILVDTDKKDLELNPTAQQIFEMEQGRLTFDSIEKQEVNKEFLALFNEAITNGKIIDETIVDFQVPIRNTRKRIAVRIIPLKNSEELVKLALIYMVEKG
ncbi:MAG: hypothetical protein ABIE84_00540 [bacterium]